MHYKFQKHTIPLLCLMLVVWAVSSFIFADPSHATLPATVFTVTSAADTNDVNAGSIFNGHCDVDTGTPGDQCTLRAAIQEANATIGSGAVAINFELASSGPQTIMLSSALPTITRTNVTIDGTTEDGSSCGDLWSGIAPIWNTVIDLNNTGITLSGGSSTIKGLELKNGNSISVPIDFINGDGNSAQCNYIHDSERAIRVGSGSDNNLIGGTSPGDGNLLSYVRGEVIVVNVANNTTIQGNFIGTNAAGDAITNNALHPNDLQFGINVGKDAVVYPVGTIIGGVVPRAGNLIDGFTGQAGFGIALVSGDHTTIQGNYIGTNRLGISSDQTLGNNAGIIVQKLSSKNTIGGTTVSARNVIGNSTLAGILNLSSSGNTIQGNYIGLGADGNTAISNQYGILLIGASSTNNIIGGTAVGMGNTIANNTNAGVVLAGDASSGYGAAGTGNSILGNTIYNNGLGIDISASPTAISDGITPNDALDADTGPNNIQNYPVLKRVTGFKTRTIVSGKLQSIPDEPFRIEFFFTPGNTHGQGKIFLGSVDIKTNHRGTRTFVASHLAPLTGEGVITTTATDSHGDTSEFSESTTPRLRFTLTPAQEATLMPDLLADENSNE